VQGKQQIQRMLDRLWRTLPRTIAGLAVTAWEDLRDENGGHGPLKGATDAASRNVLMFHLGEQARVVLRPPGTEPKAKIYLEVCSRPGTPDVPDDVWQATCRDVDGMMRNITEAFVRQALGGIGLDPSAAAIR
jgi:phosphoglucomutase